jgi:hypothetical protein
MVMLSLVSTAAASAALFQYHDNTLSSGGGASGGFNTHNYNKMYNSQSGFGPYIHIYEAKSDGALVYEAFGQGWVDISHPGTYANPWCVNRTISGYTALFHCWRQT